MAVIALKSGATIDGEDVKEFCRERMARFMVPDCVQFVDEIPKTPTGKPEKFKLIAAAAPARRHDSHTGSY